MCKCIAYLRMSTEDQKITLAAQEQKIRQYCELYNMDLIEIVTDAGISAKDLIHRPGVQRVLEMVRKKDIDAVVIAKLDRLTRNVRDLAEIVELFNRSGVSLVSVNEHIDTGSAAGRMILNMLGVISQWERETIGERTATALQYKKSKGERYNCNALYGFKIVDDRLVPDQQEQETIIRVVHLREQGFSFRKIAGELNTQGVQSRTGAPWHPETIRQIVTHTQDREQLLSYQDTSIAA